MGQNGRPVHFYGALRQTQTSRGTSDYNRQFPRKCLSTYESAVQRASWRGTKALTPLFTFLTLSLLQSLLESSLRRQLLHLHLPLTFTTRMAHDVVTLHATGIFTFTVETFTGVASESRGGVSEINTHDRVIILTREARANIA